MYTSEIAILSIILSFLTRLSLSKMFNFGSRTLP